MIKSERSMEAIRMKERLEAIRERALAQINETDSLDKLNDIRVAFLGKKLSMITTTLRHLTYQLTTRLRMNRIHSTLMIR